MDSSRVTVVPRGALSAGRVSKPVADRHTFQRVVRTGISGADRSFGGDWRDHGEYINQLRTRGLPVREAAKEGAELRLRPIMITMIVATLGLLPAAMSHDIGSDSQRPFAIVIVGGLIVELFVSVILWPTLYVFWARPGDRLPPSEHGFMVEGEHVD